MKQIYEEEGIVGYYKGFVATMLQTFSMRESANPLLFSSHNNCAEYAYFFFYSLVRGSYIKRLTSRLPKGSKAPPLSTAAELLLGAAAGALAQLFTLPVSTIATRQQIGDSQDEEGKSRNKKRKSAPTNGNGNTTADLEKGVPPLTEEMSTGSRDDSFSGVVREIYNEEGLGGFWLGLGPSLVLTVNPAITYGVFERVKSTVLLAAERTGRTDLARNGKLTPRLTFYVGSLSKILATVVSISVAHKNNLVLTCR
jgi:solute carrier family 25 (peroxisomal adenine nucleotide transporter), member 17